MLKIKSIGHVRRTGFQLIVFLLIIMMLVYAISIFSRSSNHDQPQESEVNTPSSNSAPDASHKPSYEYIYVDARHRDMSRTFTTVKD